MIDVGNNGDLSDCGNDWTTGDDLGRLFMETIPQRTEGWSKRRVMLFIHGGLNGEKDAAKRIIAYRDVCLKNEIYPLHIMWESDWLTSTRNITAMSANSTTTSAPTASPCCIWSAMCWKASAKCPCWGMQKFLRADTSLSGLPAAHPDGLPGIVVSGEEGPVGAIAKSDTHGGFDDDPNTMNSILHRILGAGPRFPFQDRDLQFQRPAGTKKSHRARWP